MEWGDWGRVPGDEATLKPSDEWQQAQGEIGRADRRRLLEGVSRRERRKVAEHDHRAAFQRTRPHWRIWAGSFVVGTPLGVWSLLNLLGSHTSVVGLAFSSAGLALGGVLVVGGVVGAIEDARYVRRQWETQDGRR